MNLSPNPDRRGFQRQSKRPRNKAGEPSEWDWAHGFISIEDTKKSCW